MSVEERREDAFLAMCVAEPARGASYIERLEPEHLVGERSRVALAWLKDHLRDPMEGLPRDDERLFSVISELIMRAEREPAEPKAMELSWLLIDRARIDREIARLRRAGESAPPVELQRERARIADLIASRGG